VRYKNLKRNINDDVNFALSLCDDVSDDQGLAIAHSFDDLRVIC
jgi:hypothetical protein